MTDAACFPTFERFRHAIDTAFELALDSREPTLALRLVAVEVQDAPVGYEQFAAHFLGPSDPQLPQATYAFRHPHLGAFPLFIVPIGRDDAGVRYEACVIRHA